MMNHSNFEEKHPRAKDGRFTKKKREESGIKLVLEKAQGKPNIWKSRPQGNISDSGNPKPITDVDGFQMAPAKPMVPPSERTSIHTPWGIIKHLAQARTFTVFALILLALFIGFLFFFVETGSNKNEPQVPEGTKTAAATIATDPSQTPVSALK